MSTNINNFYGSVSNSQIQQDTINSSQSSVINDTYGKTEELIDFLSVLKENITKIELTQDKLNALIKGVEKIEGEVKTKVKRTFIEDGLMTIKNILEGVTGNVVAAGLLYLLSNLL